jgi:hypothetical protein
LNLDFLTICLKLLRLEKNIIFTENYKKTVENDWRGLIHPKRHFETNKVYQSLAYRQNFGNEFEPNLSILDLLFCQGNQALTILKGSIIK